MTDQELDAYLDRVVDLAPPLTPEQIQILRAVFASSETTEP